MNNTTTRGVSVSSVPKISWRQSVVIQYLLAGGRKGPPDLSVTDDKGGEKQ